MSITIRHPRAFHRLVHVKKTNLFTGECSRRFFDSDRESTRLLCVIAKTSPIVFVFFVSGLIFRQLKIFESVAHPRPKVFGEKKKRVRPQDGHVEHVCKLLGSIYQKRRGHLAFVRKNE